MDYLYSLYTVLFLTGFCGYTKGVNPNERLNISVSIWDGKTTLHWKAPEWAPPSSHYDIELTPLQNGNANWIAVHHCNLTLLSCDLSDIINGTTHKYRARVRLITEQNNSTWSKITINLRDSKLLPPIFSLSGNSSSLNVRIHTSPILQKIFMYGLNYHIYLQEKGNVKMMQNVTWNSMEQIPEVSFSSLQWGREYCVRLHVEDIAGIAASEASEEQCLLLPLPEWYPFLVPTILICAVAVVLLVAQFLHGFLREPEKLPITLKSPGTGWRPLTVREVSVEIVTDKGFLLISRKAEEKTKKLTELMTAEESEERRDSMDSGVSMGQHSSEMDREARQDTVRQQKEDSGCESLDGADGSTGRRGLQDLSVLQKKNENGSCVPHQPDSVASQYTDASNLDAEDSGLMPEHLVPLVTQKLTQGFSEVETGDQGQAEGAIQSDMDNCVAVSVGYRPSQLACVCSGQGQCLWCRVGGGQQQTEHESQPVTHKHNSSTLFIQEEDLKITVPQSTALLEQADLSFLTLSLPKDSTEVSPLRISMPQLSMLDNGLEFAPTVMPISIYDMDLTFG
ncbi:interleukin-10 receptor subunit alpha [Brienomyrus brachyistius]|uniref:interleukin-10 receptor subunit alpha n=1 Tax=Brienomyrus brachyistius TaxID=42636 RepID=UPI0020B3CE7A|nr:interleukin-10 receptor subunit alpha [Brienomyrus brachyistius]